MSFYGPAILLGLMGSLHCISMCGPIALALPGKKLNRTAFTLNRLQYQLGRITTYSILGLLVGFLGSGLNLSGLQQPLSIFAGGMILLMFFLTGSLNWENPISNWVNRKIVSRMRGIIHEQFAQNRAIITFSFGLLNGLLPCGLVYVALLGALATGNPVDALLFMLLFGLGTVPALASIQWFGASLQKHLSPKIRILKPVVIVAFGCLLIVRGMNLGIPYLSPQQANATEQGLSCASHGSNSFEEQVNFLSE